MRRTAHSAGQFLPGGIPIAIALLLSLLVAAPAAAAVLSPHSAHYAVKLLSARSGSNIERVAGDMVIQWERDCSGWTMNHKTVFDVSYSTGDGVRITMTASTWEAESGKDYSFAVRTLFDDKEQSRLEGHAHRATDGNRAFFSAPEKKEMALPADVLFPAGHTGTVLDAAADAPAIVAARVFDGFTEDGAQLVNAVVGRQIAPGTGGSPAFDGIARTKAWPVRLAFFAGGDEAAPETEMGLKLHENGISEWLDMDFGDFRIRAELTRLAVLPAPACR
jgi:hypothetical protein